MDLTIVEAGVERSALLARHRCEMFREMGALADAHYDELYARSVRNFEAVIPAGTYIAFLAYAPEDPSVAIGGAGVQVRALVPRPMPDHAGVIEGEQGLILNMYVEPAFRRQGVAAALLEHVLGWCGSRGIRTIVLHASDAGRPVYERRGFEQTNEMGIFLATI